MWKLSAAWPMWSALGAMKTRNPMSYGYSARLIDANDEADGDMPGVRLGRLCIAQRISAADVASRFNISRATVYNWFCGRTKVKSQLVGDVDEFADLLS